MPDATRQPGPSPSAAESPPADRGQPVLLTAIELLGAATGVLLILYLIGGIVMAARLRALDLPIFSTLTLFSATSLLIVALQVLWLGLLLGMVLVVYAEWRQRRPARAEPTGARGAHRTRRPPSRRRRPGGRWSTLATRGTAGLRQWADLALASAVLVTAIAVQVGVTPLSWPARIAELAVALFVVALITWVLQARLRPRLRAGLLAGLVVLLAAGVRTIDELAPPTHLDYATTLMKSGELVEGFHLAQTNDAVIIAPNVRDRTTRFVAALPKREIANLSISKFEEPVLGLHQSTQQRLIGENPPALSPDERNEERAVLAYFAEIRADIGWRYPPVVPWAAVDYVDANFFAYSDAPHPWSEEDATRIRLVDLLEDPQLYVAQNIVTDGRVVRAVSNDMVVPDDGSAGSGDRWQFILLAVGPEGSEANCWLVRDRRARDVVVGDRVAVRAAVAAWGTWGGRSGEKVPELVLRCSSMTYQLGRMAVTPARPTIRAGRRVALQVDWRTPGGAAATRRIVIRILTSSALPSVVRVDVRRRRWASSGALVRPPRRDGLRIRRHRVSMQLVLRPKRALAGHPLRFEARVTDARGRTQLVNPVATATVVP